MKTRILLAVFSIFYVFLMTGCARTELVRAVEGDDVPAYNSLGTLEVKQLAPVVTAKGAFWTGVEAVTLGFAKTPSRGEHYKASLRSELAYLASHRYGADKVINVTYWPDPDSFSFPDGLIYARGEMIRYSRFLVEAYQKSQAPAVIVEEAPLPG